MRAIYLSALLALAGCTHHDLNSVSVLKYDRDDPAPEVVAKSVVNAAPWVVLGAAHVFFWAASVAPEAVESYVDTATAH